MDPQTPPAENPLLASTHEDAEPEAKPEISWNITNPSRSSKVSAETRARWELLRALAGVQRSEPEAKDESSNAGSKRNSLALSDRTHSSTAVSPSWEHQQFDRHEIEKHTRDAANKRLSQHSNRGLRPLFLPQMVEKERKQHEGDVAGVVQEPTSSQISDVGDVSTDARELEEPTIPAVAQSATEASDDTIISTTLPEEQDLIKVNTLDSALPDSEPQPANPGPLEFDDSQDAVSLPQDVSEPSAPSMSPIDTAEKIDKTDLEDSVAASLGAESIPLPASPSTSPQKQHSPLVVENESNSDSAGTKDVGESDLVEDEALNTPDSGVLEDGSETTTPQGNQPATSEDAIAAESEESEVARDADLSSHGHEFPVNTEAAEETKDETTDGSDNALSSTMEESHDIRDDSSKAPENDVPVITEESEETKIEVSNNSGDTLPDDTKDEERKRDEEPPASAPPEPSVPEPAVIPVNQRQPEEILALLALGDPATLQYIKTEEGVAWLLNMFLHGSVALAKLWAENNLLSVEMRDILMKGRT